jgi:SSS family solute:Na+ symporter
MSPTLILVLIAGYFALLIGISLLTGRSDDNETFFTGKRSSPWYVVAFGMIGASLSGVTFISVPGWVATSQFSYMQMVLGYLLGYVFIARVLLPLYYKLNLASIYAYLGQRFGTRSYKTGAFFFLISRIIGASFRLYLVATVLQLALFDAWGVPFWVTVSITIGLIWVYTFRSGIKTIVYTDTLQTAFMLLAVGIAVYMVKDELLAPGQRLINYIAASDLSQIFFWADVNDSRYFIKQFLAGASITIAMTGLDQDMMQKNLTCRNLKDAQKNMYWFSVSLVVVNLFFLSLGLLLQDYAGVMGIAASGDELFPTLALKGGLSVWVAFFFLIGLIAAAYSSADSALTSLTTSFSVDFLGLHNDDDVKGKRIRKRVHVAFSIILLAVIVVFKYVVSENVISDLFTAAGYTYGPLLGLFFFGLFTKWPVRDKWVPVVAVLSPLASYLLKIAADEWFGYTVGFELLLINGAITFLGLILLRKAEPELSQS